MSGFLKFGSPGWTRTSDIRINSPVFYQLNYWGKVFLSQAIRRLMGVYYRDKFAAGNP